MIHIVAQQKLVTFGKTDPGDLVTFTYDREAVIGIVLELNKDRDPLVGVLSTLVLQDSFART